MLKKVEKKMDPHQKPSLHLSFMDAACDKPTNQPTDMDKDITSMVEMIHLCYLQSAKRKTPQLQLVDIPIISLFLFSTAFLHTQITFELNVHNKIWKQNVNSYVLGRR